MKKVYILAVAPENKVQQAISELITSHPELSSATLISTKKYRHNALTRFVDLDIVSISDDVKVDVDTDAHWIVIQYNQTLISYINVYRFLRSVEVEDFTIKVAGQDQIETSVENVFSYFNDKFKVESTEVLNVDPSLIHLRHEFSPAHHGQTIDGDWDLNVTDFDSSVLFYESLKHRISESIEWTETSYYKDILSSLNNGESRFGCTSVKQLDTRCKQLDELFKDISTSGWKQLDGQDYVSINIGRNGQLIFNDGRHRLSMAKLLGLPSIPVKVAVRHKEWVEFKQEIKAFADKFYDGNVYAKLVHPDLASIKHTQNDSRLSLILQNIGDNSNSVLDIGSHWGYFCGQLELDGRTCTAVEADVGNFYFLDKLRKANGHSFLAVNQSIFDFVKEKSKYDVVLALNIFHHFLKTAEGCANLKVLLSHLDMKEMFLQTHDPSEPQMKGAFNNLQPEAFADFILANSKLNSKRLIADTGLGRMMYHLTV